MNSSTPKLTGAQMSPAADILTAAIDCMGEGGGKYNGKAHSRKGHEGPEGEEMYSCTSSLTSA